MDDTFDFGLGFGILDFGCEDSGYWRADVVLEVLIGG